MNDKEIELKPCPFCGRRDSVMIEEHNYGNGDFGFFVICEWCGSRSGICPSINDSMEAWNTRAPSNIE